jgi:uncharacterized membrane-anchored protein YjiN (DUF445 family)
MRAPGDAAQGLAASDAELARALARQKAPATELVVLCAVNLSDVAERLQCDEAVAFVAAQVKAWGAQHAVPTIELSFGTDLQYVRINGTLVGGLLGFLIFTASRLVSR